MCVFTSDTTATVIHSHVGGSASFAGTNIVFVVGRRDKSAKASVASGTSECGHFTFGSCSSLPTSVLAF